MRVALLSAASRWVNGGDYMGLTASADGHFHPVWADARSGTYQVYTAEVRVEDGAAVAGEPAVGGLTAGEPVDVTGRIELVNDPGAYDAETGVLDLWIRLKNVSATPIAGPIEVEIRKFGSGMDDTFAEFAPEILNADNGMGGGGARFVYDDALGTEGAAPARRRQRRDAVAAQAGGADPGPESARVCDGSGGGVALTLRQGLRGLSQGKESSKNGDCTICQPCGWDGCDLTLTE